MSRKLMVILALCMGVVGCSGQQLTRSTAQRILRENMAEGQFGNEITLEVHTQTGWSMEIARAQGNNVDFETLKRSIQPELDFLNHLVDAGVLQKAPDTFIYCNPEPDCKEQNKYFNFSVVPSKDVEAHLQGMNIQGVRSEYGTVVVARPSAPTITGITQEGNDATVEFTYGYVPTQIYTRLSQLTKDDFARCSPSPGTSSNPPSYCYSRANWLSETDIAAKKGNGSLEFRKYDDGWRTVKQPQ